ncbi:hypothetical protein K503DRAFT_775226 [Rhizopogon vinicolor AM-OR11-026]|uniref:Uncharacterized protein n=1 Tax=Rhizopogon vinicolor AM-OR11-026 TaxID=1314800 RepID=A0A1B7MMG7_9AGAM|nr:hypothetical protein K503DRAFT_775226 [Rhizopogon vinicolor AM-OR11-026]
MFALPIDPAFKLQALPAQLHPTYSLSNQSTQYALALPTTLAPPGLSPLSSPNSTPPPSFSLNQPINRRRRHT